MSRRIILSMLIAMVALAAMGQVQDLYLKGIACSDQGRYPEASEYLGRALSIDGDNADYLYKLAETKYRSGDRESALSYLYKLEQLEPGRGSYLLASIHAYAGEVDESVKYLEIHLRSPYKLPSPVILLDDAFTAIERSPQWRKLWTENWYSEDEEFLQEVRYLNSTGDQLQALEIIGASLAGRNDWDALHALRGNVLLEMDQNQGALQAFTRAIEINSSDPNYYIFRAEAFLAQDKPDKAISDLEKASRLAPERMDLLLRIGEIYHQSEDYLMAGRYLERYIEYYRDDPESLYLLGKIYYDSGRYLDALARFNSCLNLSTGDARFYAARGKTYYKTRTYNYALNDLGMALDLDPDDPEVWYVKGLVRWSLNDREGSVSDWKKAVRLGSYNAAIRLEELGISQ